jgi:hypothetical protein
MGKRKIEKKRKENFTMDKLLLTVTGERQTRPLLREGAPQRQGSKFQTELISGRRARHQDVLTD